MRRVSSRQRLVSWDAFDATANDDSSSELTDEYDDLDRTEASRSDSEPSNQNAIVSSASGGEMHSTPHRRKRDRRFKYFGGRKNHGPSAAKSTVLPDEASSLSSSSPQLASATVVPYKSWELGCPFQVEDLVDDVQVCILSFLDTESLRHVMSTNRNYRRILLSSETHHIWLKLCKQQWSCLKNKLAKGGRPKLVDQVGIPTAAGRFVEHSTNLPLLLSMAPAAELPSSIDTSLINRPVRHRRWRSSNNNELKLYDDKETGALLVRFTGDVGTGDRCIRANNPMPRPVTLNREVHWARLPKGIVKASTGDDHSHSLFDLLCRGAKAVAGGSKTLRPFVAPHIDKDGSIHISPRMVSYYEVSIKDPIESDNDDDETPIPSPFSSRRRQVSDCVAVGLASGSFHLQSRMPGWCSSSWGFHGDDGGYVYLIHVKLKFSNYLYPLNLTYLPPLLSHEFRIFHSSGAMVRQFGPRFGSGDTVGCGIDYTVQGIFFTLNGTFLGYGWTGVDCTVLQNDLYPVVGIDTRSPIECNFGSKPFSFDLTSFLIQHKDDVKQLYEWPKSKAASVPRVGRAMSRGS